MEPILHRLTFRQGVRDGLPICLGYLSVSFAFGMMVTQGGYPVWTAMLISMTNLTSAGQFAGFSLIARGAAYTELAAAMLVVNIRYLLMSLSLSQRVPQDMGLLHRLCISFGITDEIFVVASGQEKALNAKYLYGLILMPFLGWSAGTFLGAAATGLLPASLRSALGIALYAMLIAIIIPPSRKSRTVLIIILLSALVSCMLRFLPVFSGLSGGWVIIICAVSVSAFAAWRMPAEEVVE